MKKNIAGLLLLSMSICCLQGSWADRLPFCLDPQRFPVSMQTSPAQVNMKRYLGAWFELATIEGFFNDECKCTMITYGIDSEERVEFLSLCKKEDNTVKEIFGLLISQNEQNTKQVLSDLTEPLLSNNYWILDIDSVFYSWVVVGEPCKRSAWILSRSQYMAKKSLDARIAVLAEKGYNTSKMIIRQNTC